jgi:hypothetical protein
LVPHFMAVLFFCRFQLNRRLFDLLPQQLNWQKGEIS